MTVIWMFVIVVGVVIDICTSGFLFTAFSTSAVFALLAETLGVDSRLQVSIFLFVSILLILTVVPIIRRKIESKGDLFIQKENRAVGKVITLTKDIEETGQEKIDGVYWTLVSPSGPIRKNTKVKITSIDGTKYVIEKIER